MADVTVEDANGTVRVILGNIGTPTAPGYGLKVIAADGSTAIIDGNSDMFRIAATGTATVSQTGAGITTTVVSIPGTGLSGTNSPAFLAFITEGTSPPSSGNREIGRQFILGVGFVAPTSGGSPTTRGEYVRYSGGAYSTISGGQPAIVLYADQGEGGATVAAFSMRWYLLQQVGI